MQNKYTVADLPVELELPKVSTSDASGTVVSWIGWIVTIVGGLTIVFGPNTLQISYAGPTFFEFIQLYPGPITSVGFLIIMAGQFISNQTIKEALTDFQESVDSQLSIPDEDIPAGKELSINLIEQFETSDLYRFELIDKEVSEEPLENPAPLPPVSLTKPE